MKSLVQLFFVAATLATLTVGATFAKQTARALRSFGVGLLLNGVAFAIWTAAVIVKPDSGIDDWVTVGVFFFFVGIVLFASSWVADLSGQQRTLAVVIGAAWVIGVVALRIAYPSHPFFSEDGLFFFNPHGSVAAFEIFGLGAGMLPAIFRIAREFEPRSALLAKVGFTTLVFGGMVLVTSHDEVLLNFDGWAMGAAFVAVTAWFVARKPAEWKAV